MIQPTVSLILATYGRHDILPNIVRMALSQDYENLELVIVDQTSVPLELPTELRTAPSNFLRYYWHPHPNLPAARNAGIRASSGEIVIFLDDDVVIGRDYVSSIVRTYTSDDIGGVCGVSIPEGCRDCGSEAKKFAHLLDLDESFKPGEVLAVKSMIGVNMSFPRRVLVEAGLFDEAFTGSGWGEDNELAIRVRRLGYRFLLNTNIEVIHLEPLAGGCSNRDPVAAERIRRERLLFRLYILLKHANGQRLNTMQELYRLYRQHALNKVQLRSGVSAMIERHREMLAAARAVAAYLACRRSALL